MFQKALAKKHSGKKGFTLIEMIVVIAIIAVLIALVAPMMLRYLDTAKDTKANAAAKSAYTAAQAYVAEEAMKNNKITADLTSEQITEVMKFLDNNSGITIKAVVIENGNVKSATVTVDGKDVTYPIPPTTPDTP